MTEHSEHVCKCTHLKKCHKCKKRCLRYDCAQGQYENGDCCTICKKRLCDDCLDDDVDTHDEWAEDPHDPSQRICFPCCNLLPPHDKKSCWSCDAWKVRDEKEAARVGRKFLRTDVVWLRMLECAVDPPSAKVIAAKYPTPSALVAACAESRKRTADEIDPIAELALPDGKRVGKDVASNLRIHFSD